MNTISTIRAKIVPSPSVSPPCRGSICLLSVVAYNGSLTWTKANHTIRAASPSQVSKTPWAGHRPPRQLHLPRRLHQACLRRFHSGQSVRRLRVVGKGVETGRSTWHDYYINDDWKLTRKHLNLGLRYEYVAARRRAGPPLYLLSAHQRLWLRPSGQVIVRAAPNQILGLNGARAVYKADRNNWAPRIALPTRSSPRPSCAPATHLLHQFPELREHLVISRRQPPFAETQQSPLPPPRRKSTSPTRSSAPAPLVIGTRTSTRLHEGYGSGTSRCSWFAAGVGSTPVTSPTKAQTR